MKDIRVNVGMADHYKTRRLVRMAGEGAFRCLVRLWSWAAQNRPRGVLAEMTAGDIADASGWAGDPAEWVRALVECGWLNPVRGACDPQCGTQCDPHYELHDWEEHQPYAFHGDSRKRSAKRAAQVRWGKRLNTGRIAECNAPPPTPTPTPTPVGGGREAHPPPPLAPTGAASSSAQEVERSRVAMARLYELRILPGLPAHTAAVRRAEVGRVEAALAAVDPEEPAAGRREQFFAALTNGDPK